MLTQPLSTEHILHVDVRQSVYGTVLDGTDTLGARVTVKDQVGDKFD